MRAQSGHEPRAVLLMLAIFSIDLTTAAPGTLEFGGAWKRANTSCFDGSVTVTLYVFEICPTV